MVTSPAAFLIGIAILIIVVWDAFEVIILPRRVTRRFRLSRLFYKSLWTLWRFCARLVPARKVRESALSIFGPISLLILVAIWALGLVLSFGLMQYGAGSALNVAGVTPSFWTDAYLSGTTFFTLGLGDVVPRSGMARALVVVEGGLGFGFLAGVIGYLPFIYGSFSKREVSISLLDVLAFFRSQHDNQSWVASLTAILDSCALIMVGIEGACERQAELTFAIARHAVVDLSQVFNTSPKELSTDRLPPPALQHIRDVLAQHGLKLHDDAVADQRLSDLRRMYEPYIYALATYLNQSLPPWIPPKKGKDNWQTTAWGKTAGLVEPQAAVAVDDHF